MANGIFGTNTDILYINAGGGGLSSVIHDETLSGNGTSASPLGAINIPLAVNETMTAYEEVVGSENALVLGVNSAWVDGKLDNKLDISAYSATSGLAKIFPMSGTDSAGYSYTANANCSSFELIKNKDLEVENVKLFTSGFNYIDNQNDLNVSWSSLKDIPAQLSTLSSHDVSIVNSNKTQYYIGRNTRMRVTTGFNYDYAPNAPVIESYDGDIEDGWWSPAGGPCFSTAYSVTSDNIRVGGLGGYGTAYSGEYSRLEFHKRGAYFVELTTPFKITSPGTNGGQYYINFQFNVNNGYGTTYRNKLINRALVCEYADTWTLPVIITGTSGYLSVGASLHHTSAASANDGFSGVFGRMIPHAIRVGDSITGAYEMPWNNN